MSGGKTSLLEKKFIDNHPSCFSSIYFDDSFWLLKVTILNITMKAERSDQK